MPLALEAPSPNHWAAREVPPQAGFSPTPYSVRVPPVTQPGGHSLVRWWHSALGVTACMCQRNGSCSRGLGNPDSAPSERASAYLLDLDQWRQGVGKRTLARLLGDQVQVAPGAVQKVPHESPHSRPGPQSPSWGLGGTQLCPPPGQHTVGRLRNSAPSSQILPSASSLLALLSLGAAQEGAPWWPRGEPPHPHHSPRKTDLPEATQPSPGLAQALPLSLPPPPLLPGALPHREWALSLL